MWGRARVALVSVRRKSLRCYSSGPIDSVASYRELADLHRKLEAQFASINLSDLLHCHRYQPHLNPIKFNISTRRIDVGSLVEYRVCRRAYGPLNKHESSRMVDSYSLGVVLSSPKPRFLTPNPLEVLSAHGTVVHVDPEDVKFRIHRFIKPKAIDTDRSVLQYILLSTARYATSIVSKLGDHSLLDTIYLQTTNLYHQKALNLHHLAAIAVREIPQLVQTNVLDIPALFLASHVLMVNDPVRFRFAPPKTTPEDYLEPLSVATMSYFANPHHLAQSLRKILSLPAEILNANYGHLFSGDYAFELFQTLREGTQVLEDLVSAIKYAIEYPHPLLLRHLRKVLGRSTKPRELYDMLVQSELCPPGWNPVLSSGIYGLPNSAGIFSEDQLKLPAKIKSDRRVNNPERTDSQTKYRLADRLLFSSEDDSISSTTFSFYLPVATQDINDQMSEFPVAFSHNINYAPFFPKFKRSVRNQKALRVSFKYDMYKIETVDKPEIEISYENIDGYTDMVANYPSAAFSLFSKMDLEMKDAIQRLYFLLKHKEKLRLENGYLKTEKQAQESVEWYVRNCIFFCDELLSEYCLKNKIPVIGRVSPKLATKSEDRRSYTGFFNLFSRDANSYQSFADIGRAYNKGVVSATDLVCALRYLDGFRVQVLSPQNSAYAVLGTRAHASFFSPGFLESYINNAQLMNHLQGRRLWNMEKLLFQFLGNFESQLQMHRRLHRYRVLSELENQLEDEFSMFRCIITEPQVSSLVQGYCHDLEVNVEIQVDADQRLMVGDRILCSQILELDPYSDTIVMR
ncbi:hypothetical protein KL924_000041 [Ogataea haglerorum]|nr:hypothetical protein KL924_000041 [Ogataea haglerorum]